MKYCIFTFEIKLKFPQQLHNFWFYFFLSFFGYASSQVQRVQHEILTKQDGIELDAIATLAFDKDGFLWLGGSILDNRSIILSDKKISLQRFNGKSFHSIVIPEELGFASVSQLLKREDGKMYVNDSHRLALFNPFTTKFEKIPLDVDGISNVKMYDGVHYLLTQKDRIISLNILNQDLTLTELFSFTSNQLRFLVDTSTTRFIPFDDYWLISDDNFPINIIKNDGTIIKTFDDTAFSRRRGTSEGKIWLDEIFKVDGVYYSMLFKNAVLHTIDTASLRLKPMQSPNAKLPNANIKAFTDPKGAHIISSSDGTKFSLSTYDTVEGFITLFSDDAFDESVAMELISEDLSSNLWMANKNKAELHYFKFPKKEVINFLPNTEFRAITALDSTRYLVATESEGWYTFDREKKSLEHFGLKLNGEDFKPNSSRNFFKAGNTIWSHSGSSVIEVDLPTKSLKSYRLYPISCMVQPTDSTLVYGTNNYNLMEFNLQTKRHDTLAITDSLQIHDLEYQKRHEIIVGATNKGMLLYDMKTKNAKLYNDPNLLEDPFLLMAVYHEDYGFLIGSRSGKIYSYHPENKTFTKLYADDLNAGIATILFRGDTWWISTFNGIVAYNVTENTRIRYSVKDGFSDNEGNRHSAYDTGEGLLIGTIAGLNYFDPNVLKPETLKSELALLKIRQFHSEENKILDVFNRELLNKGSPIVLPAENRLLQIEFALTNNCENREHSFRYRINNEDFIEIEDEQSIRFPNLAAGNYTLEIEARDFSSKKIGTPLVLQIESKNFFYKTWWFNILIAILVIALLTYLLKQSQLKRKLQQRFSQDLILSQEEERTRIAKELHDSVGQQLTLIKQRAQNEAQTEITEMTHNALEEVRSISRGLYPSVLKQLGLTESIEQLVYEMDMETEMFFTTDIDPIDSYFSKMDSLNFYRFTQECLTNIIKHAHAKTVFIGIKRIKNIIHVIIEDNGVGFDVQDAEKTKSLGLKTLHERIRILNGTLRFQSKHNSGTRVMAEIPIK